MNSESNSILENDMNERDEIIEQGKKEWVFTKEDEQVWNSLSDDDKYMLAMADDLGFWFDNIEDDEEALNHFVDVSTKFSREKYAEEDEEEEVKETPEGYERFEGYLNDPYQPIEVGTELITRDGQHYWITFVDEWDNDYAWGSQDKADIGTERGYSIDKDDIEFVKPRDYNESLEERKDKPQESKESSKVRNAIDLINGDIARSQGYKLDGDTLILGNGVKFKFSKLVIDRLKELGYGNKQNESLQEEKDMSEQRYYAKEVNGKGYIFDRTFSEKAPIAVEKTIDFAQQQVDKFNKEEGISMDNKQLEKEFGLPEEVTVDITEFDYDDEEDLADAVSDYLSDNYGFLHYGFNIDDSDIDSGKVRVYDIDWDVESEDDLDEGVGALVADAVISKGIETLGNMASEFIDKEANAQNESVESKEDGEFIVLVFHSDELEDFKYTDNYQADAHFDELYNMSELDMENEDILGFVQLEKGMEDRLHIVDKYFLPSADEAKFIGEVDEYIDNLNESCKKPLKESVDEKIETTVRDYMLENDSHIDDKMFDLLCELVNRVDDYNEEENILSAVDDGMIYTDDQWTAYRYYCDMGDPVDDMWSFLELDVMNICSRLAGKSDNDVKDDPMTGDNVWD